MFLLCSKVTIYDSPRLPPGLATCYDAVPGSLQTALRTVAIFCPVISIFFGSLNKHLADKWLPTDADVKQSDTSWLHTRGTDFLYSGIQTFVPWLDKRSNVSVDVCHPLLTCYAQAEIRIKFTTHSVCYVIVRDLLVLQLLV